MFTPPKHVTCHVSRVTCHVSGVTCQVSHVTIFSFFSGQSGEAYRWRVCYQMGPTPSSLYLFISPGQL